MNSYKNKQIEEIKSYMNLLINERKDIFERIKSTSKEENNQEVTRLNEISRILEELNSRILLIEGPTCSNHEIDIYLNKEESDDEVECYFITPHQSLEQIGYVRVSLKSFDPYLGHIGYGITEKYRGNHYALQALGLLKNTILSHGLNKIIITAFADNYASIKTIERFGGTLTSSEDFYQNRIYNTYEVNLQEETSPKR